MKLFTIGFTKKSASRFFDLLLESGVKRILDVRINNGPQLAGFAKKDELAYFRLYAASEGEGGAV